MLTPSAVTSITNDLGLSPHDRQSASRTTRRESATSNATRTQPHTTTAETSRSYATALINAGVSLQALMALLGHVSTQMSLRYAHLFDSTVRTEYERALDLAKSQIGPLAADRPQLPITDITGSDWKQAPAIKSRLAGGYCLRAPAQGTCPYANICEHCPSFHTDATHLGVLAAQRVDAQQLAEDAQSRGWVDEARRHQQLVARLDILIAEAGTETA